MLQRRPLAFLFVTKLVMSACRKFFSRLWRLSGEENENAGDWKDTRKKDWISRFFSFCCTWHTSSCSHRLRTVHTYRQTLLHHLDNPFPANTMLAGVLLILIVETVAGLPSYLSTRISRAIHSGEYLPFRGPLFLPTIPRQTRLSSGNNIDEPPRNQAQVYRLDAQTLSDSQSEQQLRHKTVPRDELTPVESQVVDEVWNWCAHFVVPYNLCPWASASVRNSHNAISFFLVEPPDSSREQERHFERALYIASRSFQSLLEKEENAVDPSHTIGFVIQVPSGVEWDFLSFYNWFLDAEEEMIEHGIADDEVHEDENEVIWAPFHPHWSYRDAESEGDDDETLQIEKQTPYPLVSIVDAAVIDKAGESATAKIGLQNEEILSAKPLSEWNDLYARAIQRTADDNMHS